MKVAILIAVHKNPIQLKRLIHAFQSDAFTFFIHVDKKTDIKQFEELITIPNVQFIKKRTNVKWATYSQVKATQICLEEICAWGDFDYINFISGQDFPIKSQEEFLRLLKDSPDNEYINCIPYHPQDSWWVKNEKRITQYNLQNWIIPGKYKIQKIINTLLPARKLPQSHTIAGNSCWFCITGNCAKFVTEQMNTQKELLRFFKYVWGADEMVIPTIVFNSKYAMNTKNHLTFVSWGEKDDGHPEILSSQRLTEIIASDKYFARKFDMEIDNEIILFLEKNLIQSN